MTGEKILGIAAWLIFFINWFSFNSCTDDNLADLMKRDDTTSNVICDTTFMISYKYDITPIIKTNCSACHYETTAFLGNDIRLDTWEFLKVKVDDNKLLCAINWENGCEPMPKDKDKLEDCYILRITAWVSQGANNN